MTHTTILIHGAYNTGKKDIVAAFTGKPVSSLISNLDDNFSSQLKGTKGDVTIQGMPQEFGRMPAFRERAKTISATQAVIFTVNETNQKNLEFFHNSIKKSVPSIILYTYLTDKAPEVPDFITKFASKNNMKVELLNVHPEKLSSDSIKLEKIIANLEFEVKYGTVTPASDEKKLSSSSPLSFSDRFIRFFSFFGNTSTAAA